MNFYFFRHGITYVSKHGLEYGDSEETASILPEAKPTLEKMGRYLKDITTDINLTSPYKRCLETVAIVSKASGKKFEVDDNLGEYRPDVEIIEKFVQRMKNFIDKMKSKNYENVLICSHGYPIQAMITYLIRHEVTKKDLDPYPNTGVLSIVKLSPEASLHQLSF